MKKKKDEGGLARDTHIKHTLKCGHTVNSEQEQSVMQRLLRRACTEWMSADTDRFAESGK